MDLSTSQEEDMIIENSMAMVCIKVKEIVQPLYKVGLANLSM